MTRYLVLTILGILFLATTVNAEEIKPGQPIMPWPADFSACYALGKFCQKEACECYASYGPDYYNIPIATYIDGCNVGYSHCLQEEEAGF